MSKRIVFVHPDGLHQILGVLEAPEGTELELPVALGPVGVVGRLVPFCSLVKVRRAAAYYREPLLPTSAQSFHEAQQ